MDATSRSVGVKAFKAEPTDLAASASPFGPKTASDTTGDSASGRDSDSPSEAPPHPLSSHRSRGSRTHRRSESPQEHQRPRMTEPRTCCPAAAERRPRTNAYPSPAVGCAGLAGSMPRNSAERAQHERCTTWKEGIRPAPWWSGPGAPTSHFAPTDSPHTPTLAPWILVRQLLELADAASACRAPGEPGDGGTRCSRVGSLASSKAEIPHVRSGVRARTGHIQATLDRFGSLSQSLGVRAGCGGLTWHDSCKCVPVHLAKAFPRPPPTSHRLQPAYCT